jgi:hypothetical protein
MPIRTAWIKAFVKEFHGLVITQKAVMVDEPKPHEPVVPVRDLYKCKLDKFGNIDKLKARIVFRGDMYDPLDPLDSWNPHASWFSLRMFCAVCAKYNIFLSQTDFVMAYLQVKMKEWVHISFPTFWAEHLPAYLRDWCGKPLLLLKALYRYTYSRKFLFEEQADFFTEFGL